MTHTPGPWTSHKTSFGAKVVDVQDVTVADIPQQPEDTWQAVDTAKIIAATPKLLEAAKKLVAIDDEWLPDDDPTSVLECFGNAADELRDAVAKAE